MLTSHKALQELGEHATSWIEHHDGETRWSALNGALDVLESAQAPAGQWASLLRGAGGVYDEDIVLGYYMCLKERKTQHPFLLVVD